MRAQPLFLLAPLRVCQRYCLVSAIFVLVCFISVSSRVSAAATAQGKSLAPMHGPGYEHLDCSACLAVARTLFYRINKTLAENPTTYLISHRLGKQNELRRSQYHNSELLVSEVMEDMCTSYGNDELWLRLHPKSKVRLYHQQFFGDAKLGMRHALREDEIFPADEDPTSWADKRSEHRYAIAKLYSRKDADALRGLQNRYAAPTMCARLVEEFEEEIEELVKVARSHAETEYGLCGMELPANFSDSVQEKRSEGSKGTSVRPVTNVCADVEVLRAAAHRDQQRWEQHQLRKKKIEELKASEQRTTADTGPSLPASGSSTEMKEVNGKSAALRDSSEAPREDLGNSSPEVAVNTRIAENVQEKNDDYVVGDL